MRTLWKPAVLLTLLTTAGVSSVLVAQTAADPERNREVVRRHLELMNRVIGSRQPICLHPTCATISEHGKRRPNASSRAERS
jgi:hypothetical protein